MTSRFMMSVAAAALIAGTGFANAQGSGPGREAQTQQSAPAEHGTSAAPAKRDAAEPMAPSSGMKSTQSGEKMAPNGAGNQRAQDNAPGQKPNNMRSENNNATGGKDMGGKDMKAEGRDRDNNMKAEGRDNNKAEGRDNKMNAESKGATENRSQTTGQAGAGAKLSVEQRTKISTVIKQQNIRPVEHVNFSISVGTRVPRDVGFHPLPTEIVTIYPDWRGYEMILVGDQIVVVNPRTLEIVAVLDV